MLRWQELYTIHLTDQEDRSNGPLWLIWTIIAHLDYKLTCIYSFGIYAISIIMSPYIGNNFGNDKEYMMCINRIKHATRFKKETT